MKKINLTTALCLITVCLLLVFTGCSKDSKKYQTYTIYTPVLADKAEVLKAINGNVAQPIVNGGKIYIKDKFIFLNEIDKGIHVIDNSSPTKPVQVAFLNIPGCEDIAVKGNTLYADMYGDLLTIDIADPKNVVLQKLLPNIFVERMYPHGFTIAEGKIAVDWIIKDTMFEVINSNPECGNCGIFFDAATGAKATTGVAGSMAKMVLINNYLYAIMERHSLGIIDVANASSPSLASSMSAGFDLETIYPFQNKLFLGSAVGMFMFDISNPAQPAAVGTFAHGRACDPVVADGDYAYVTLRSGTECGGENNELDVIDIKNIQQPELVKAYGLTKPTGLCKDGKLLFVCDGSAGLKLYDATKADDLRLLKQLQVNEPFDVIAFNKIALVVAKAGLYQYDYSNVNNIHQVSFIPIKK